MFLFSGGSRNPVTRGVHGIPLSPGVRLSTSFQVKVDCVQNRCFFHDILLLRQPKTDKGKKCNPQYLTAYSITGVYPATRIDDH